MTVRIHRRPPEVAGDRQRPSFRGEGEVTGGVKCPRGGAALAGQPIPWMVLNQFSAATVMNKYLSLAALLVATLGLVSDLHSQTKPRAEQKGSWKTLDHKGFGAWIIASFEMMGNAADGGSLVYSFVTDKGLEFDVMAANDSYWTDDEIAKKMQVFYLVHGDRFYKVHQGSDREKHLLRMLTSAKSRLKGEGHEDPKLLDMLLLHLRTRMPWPEDEEEEEPKESGQAEEAF